MFAKDFSYSHCAQKFIHHEDHEEHEETLKPLETHFSCSSCACGKIFVWFPAYGFMNARSPFH